MTRPRDVYLSTDPAICALQLVGWADRLVGFSPRRAAEEKADYPPDLSAAIEAALWRDSRCQLCGRRLLDPLSVKRRVGPECAGKAT